MKLKLVTKDNKATGDVQLPKQFQEDVRPDLIKRAVHALQSSTRQSYGADTEAGLRASVRISKRRHKYRSTYGIGQSRTPRKVMNYRGSRFMWEGAFAPQTVGGRRAHPPKASKRWDKSINTKERRKALRSALAATLDKTLVGARGHKAPEAYPFILAKETEQIAKTKDAKAMLERLGLSDDLARADENRIRAGKGTMRGRKHKRATSALIVTSKDCPLHAAAGNIPGVDVATVDELNAGLLAPGAIPGRLTLYTETALKRLDEEHLFTDGQQRPKQTKAKKTTAKKTTTKKPAPKKTATKKTTKKTAEVKA